MNQLDIFTSTAATMTSREIAELTGKQHSHVCRDIRSMIEKRREEKYKSQDEGSEEYDRGPRKQYKYLKPSTTDRIIDKFFDDPDLDDYGISENKDSRGYVDYYSLDFEATMIVVTGYDVVRRAAVIRRWKALEEGAATPAFAIPTNLADALQLAADQARENQKLQHQIETDRPKVIALDRFSAADGSMNPTNAAKHLGVRPKDLTAFLSASRWFYRRAGGRSAWTGYQDKIQQGLLEHKPYISISEDGTETMRQQVYITAKGIARLAILLSIRVGATNQ